MRYAELNLFGVYVAPISLMMLAAWVVLIPLRRLADRFAASPTVSGCSARCGTRRCFSSPPM